MPSSSEPAPPEPISRGGIFLMGLNLVVAVPMALLALWLTVADFAYPGNLLFQDSMSLFVMNVYLGLVCLLMLISAALPKRIVIAAILLMLSRSAMGWPFSLVIDHNSACRIVSLSLLVLGAIYIGASLFGPLMKLHLRPWFQLRHSISAINLWIGVALAFFPVIVLGYIQAGKSVMGDYVQISWNGISLVERVFKKEDLRVHLIGMMHIGDGSFYENLEKRMKKRPDRGRRLVLTEGVTDVQNLLPPDFTSGQSYAKMASAFGLEPQNAPTDPNQNQEKEKRGFDVPGVSFRNADIDVSALKKQHLEHLVAVLDLFDAIEDPQSLLSNPVKITGRDLELLIFDGLLSQRNDVLMQNLMNASPGQAEVFIPWGAAHLPDIETRLLSQGFVQEDEVVRPIVRFWE